MEIRPVPSSLVSIHFKTSPFILSVFTAKKKPQNANNILLDRSGYKNKWPHVQIQMFASEYLAFISKTLSPFHRIFTNIVILFLIYIISFLRNVDQYFVSNKINTTFKFKLSICLVFNFWRFVIFEHKITTHLFLNMSI